MGRSMSHMVDQVSNSPGGGRREPIDAIEVARILTWKARTRAGWQACADYCGRNVEDVRQACEAVLAGSRIGAPSPVGGPKAAEREGGRAPDRAPDRPPGPVWANTEERHNAEVLAALKDGPATVPALSGRCRMEDHRLRSALRRLLDLDLVARCKSRGTRAAVWALKGDLPALEVAAVPPGGKRLALARERRARVVRAMGRGALSIGEISQASGMSRPFVRVTVAAMVAAERAAFSGTRPGKRGRAVELWVMVGRDG
ncbi:MAG: hypothetical protein GC145_06130 [Caulobacter sp.]|nr:hypothetical protein [Caulobacter sp.]